VSAVTFTLTDQDGLTGSCTVEVAAAFQLGTTAADVSNTGLAVENLSTGNLTIVNGDLIVNNAWVAANGSVIDKKWIKGHLIYTASTPVTVRNSVIQGRPFTGAAPYDAIVRARSTSTPVTAVLSLFNCVVTAVQPDVGIVSMAGERLGDIERCLVELGSDLIDIWDNDRARVRGCLLRRPVFWANDPKHTNDGSHPGWSHNDGIQANRGNGHQYIGNTIDMHCDPNFGDPAVLAAGGFPNLDWGGNIMLTGSGGLFQNVDIWGNRLLGGQVHIAMPYQNASNPNETGNSWNVHHNGHDLPHAYSGGSRQFVRWGWAKIPGGGVSSVHDEYLLSEGNVPVARRGQVLPAATLQGSATAASGQFIVRITQT
jgi:hypothetical protein